MTHRVVFLEFVVSAQGVSADPKKIQAIVEWPEPQNIREVRSFHEVATFYKRFIKGFNTIMVLLTDYLNREEFQWPVIAAKAFKKIKQRMTETPTMRLPDFSKVFEGMCGASGISKGRVLSQEKNPIAFFSEKLSELN